MARLDFTYMEGGAAASAALPPTAGDLFDLGIRFSTGSDVEPDLVAAHKWFNLAARAGNEEAALHRQNLAAEMSAADISMAQRAAREWLSTH